LIQRQVDTTETTVRMSLLTLFFISYFSYKVLDVLEELLPLVMPGIFGISWKSLGNVYLWLLYFLVSDIAPILIFVGSYFFSSLLLKRRYKLVPLQETYPHVNKTVDSLAILIGLKKPPKSYLLHAREPNSFVFGRNKDDVNLVLTDNLIHVLNPIELEAVILHELGHVVNRDMVFMTIGDSFIKAFKYYLPIFCLYGILVYRVDWGVFVNTVALIPLFIVMPYLIVNSVSRIREFLADATSSLATQESEVLRSSLFKVSLWTSLRTLVPSRLAIITQKRSLAGYYRLLFENTLADHPPIERRMEALSRGKNLRGRFPVPDTTTSLWIGINSFLVVVIAREISFHRTIEWSLWSLGLNQTYLLTTILIMLLPPTVIVLPFLASLMANPPKFFSSPTRFVEDMKLLYPYVWKAWKKTVVSYVVFDLLYVIYHIARWGFGVQLWYPMLGVRWGVDIEFITMFSVWGLLSCFLFLNIGILFIRVIKSLLSQNLNKP